MGALTLVVSALLAADVSNGVVVVVGRRTDVTVADANAVAADVSRALATGKVPVSHDAAAFAKRLLKLGVKDTSSCAGKKQCIAELARQLQAPWSVALSLSRVDAERAVALELIRTSDQAVVARESLVLARTDKLTPELLIAFVDKVRVALGLAPEPKPPEEVKGPPTDAPVEARVLPPPPLVPPPAPPVEVAVPAAPPRSHTVPIVLGSASATALVAGVVLTVLSVSTRARLTPANGQTLSDYTGSQALALNQRANVELEGAAAAGAVGLGLGITALALW
jgi:hypothetical protein